jgi:hypothetical protein
MAGQQPGRAPTPGRPELAVLRRAVKVNLTVN